MIPIFSPYDLDGVTPRLYNYYSDATDSYSPTLRKFVYSTVAERDFSDNIQRGMGFDGNTTLTQVFRDVRRRRPQRPGAYL